MDPRNIVCGYLEILSSDGNPFDSVNKIASRTPIESITDLTIRFGNFIDHDQKVHRMFKALCWHFESLNTLTINQCDEPASKEEIESLIQIVNTILEEIPHEVQLILERAHLDLVPMTPKAKVSTLTLPNPCCFVVSQLIRGKNGLYTVKCEADLDIVWLSLFNADYKGRHGKNHKKHARILTSGHTVIGPEQNKRWKDSSYILN